MNYTHRYLVKEEVEYFARKKIFEHVLEIGAGLNSFEKELGYKKYTKIDNESQYKGDSIKMDVHNMEYKDKFDLVFSCHVAEHFISPVLAWSNIYNSLKEGGQILSITPNCCEHQILKGDNDHIFVLNQMQWIRLLTNIGFKNVKSYVQMTHQGKQIPKEQDYNIITVATK